MVILYNLTAPMLRSTLAAPPARNARRRQQTLLATARRLARSTRALLATTLTPTVAAAALTILILSYAASQPQATHLTHTILAPLIRRVLDLLHAPAIALRIPIGLLALTSLTAPTRYDTLVRAALATACCAILASIA